MARIGLFGGSFDPVHLAHLILAERAREECELDRVIFMPARQPPHKQRSALAPAADRLQMLRLAIADNPFFELSTLEFERQEPSYTLLTVRRLRQTLGSDSILFLMLGSDSIHDLPNWWRPDELIREVELICLPRPGFALDDLSALEERFGAAAPDRIRRSVIGAPMLAVSSTEVRQRAREGRSIRYLVPEPIREYILARRLYLKD